MNRRSFLAFLGIAPTALKAVSVKPARVPLPQGYADGDEWVEVPSGIRYGFNGTAQWYVGADVIDLTPREKP